MLVLSRKEGETIRIGDDIVLMVVRIDRHRVRLGIDAPASVAIRRSELIYREQEKTLAQPMTAQPMTAQPMTAETVH